MCYCFFFNCRHLQSPSLTIVSNACGALWNLSARCPEDQRTLIELNAVPMLRCLIQSKHRMISMGSAAALKNLLAAKPDGINADDGPPPGPLAARRQRAQVIELENRMKQVLPDFVTSPTAASTPQKVKIQSKSITNSSSGGGIGGGGAGGGGGELSASEKCRLAQQLLFGKSAAAADDPTANRLQNDVEEGSDDYDPGLRSEIRWTGGGKSDVWPIVQDIVKPVNFDGYNLGLMKKSESVHGGEIAAHHHHHSTKDEQILLDRAATSRVHNSLRKKRVLSSGGGGPGDVSVFAGGKYF